MGRRITGTADLTRGTWFARVTVAPKKRKGWAMAWCETEEDALARVAVVVEVVQDLRDAHRHEMVIPLAEQAARAPTARDLAGVLTLVRMAVEGTEALERAASLTFAEHAARWTDGRMHAEFPDKVKDRDYEQSGELSRLRKWILPIVGEVPIAHFDLDHAAAVMRQPELTKGSRRHVAQIMVRLLNLAVTPCRIILHSPFPRGWLPLPPKPKAGSFLYPEEESRLLACTAIPLLDRLIYGFLAREGMRASEAGNLTWADVDLVRGAVSLDENKTDEPRSWMLDPGVTAALTWWRARNPADRWVFEVPGKGKAKGTRRPINVRHLASELRAALVHARVTRAALFVRTESRLRLRAHDLRATFVTLSLANGKTDSWVTDRTGHKSSVMLKRYKRPARMAGELALGPLAPMNEAIPEMGETSANVRNGGNQGGGAVDTSPNAEETSATEGSRTPKPFRALEPKDIRGNAGDSGARNSRGTTAALATVALLEDATDVCRTFARRPRSRVGRAADLAVRAALTGDPAVIGPAMLALAHVAKRSPVRPRVPS